MDLSINLFFSNSSFLGFVRHRFLALENNVKEVWLDIGNEITYTKIVIEKKNDKTVELTSSDITLNIMSLGNQLVLKVGGFWSNIK